jgi:hypothetical protein
MTTSSKDLILTGKSSLCYKIAALNAHHKQGGGQPNSNRRSLGTIQFFYQVNYGRLIEGKGLRFIIRPLPVSQKTEFRAKKTLHKKHTYPEQDLDVFCGAFSRSRAGELPGIHDIKPMNFSAKTIAYKQANPLGIPKTHDKWSWS